MTDDLDNFFAKKKGKKNLSQDTDSLARKLEKAVKQQEQIDRVREEEERINKERIQAVESQQHTEIDSEWIEVEPELDVALSEKLQELEIDEIQVDEKDEAPEMVEKPRTWEPVLAEQPVEKEPEPEVTEKQPTKYVPPSLRVSAHKSDQPNLQDSEQFPSLVAAIDISKKEVEKRKLKALQEKQFEDRERDLARKRQENLAAIERTEKEKDRSSTPEQTADKKPAAEIITISSTPNPAAPPKYVPPHLRNRVA